MRQTERQYKRSIFLIAVLDLPAHTASDDCVLSIPRNT